MFISLFFLIKRTTMALSENFATLKKALNSTHSAQLHYDILYVPAKLVCRCKHQVFVMMTLYIAFVYKAI